MKTSTIHCPCAFARLETILQSWSPPHHEPSQPDSVSFKFAIHHACFLLVLTNIHLIQVHGHVGSSEPWQNLWVFPWVMLKPWRDSGLICRSPEKSILRFQKPYKISLQLFQKVSQVMLFRIRLLFWENKAIRWLGGIYCRWSQDISIVSQVPQALWFLWLDRPWSYAKVRNVVFVNGQTWWHV